ncbi:MAG: HD domain-containing protein [Chromatiales bacterium]|jgi:(p)ppGpp synthase/HD superfamily hydrolase|nr:HD domain-containing protein [Chromatiales bacterium]
MAVQCSGHRRRNLRKRLSNVLRILDLLHLKLVFKAIDFAADKHRNQRRKDPGKTPYINHPLDLANTLIQVGEVVDPEVICAAILHDTIEDTDATEAEIAQAFGKPIRDIVLEVSDDKSLDKMERKRLQIVHAPHISYQAKLVKLADKISNANDMARAQPIGWTDQRRREYLTWSRAVVDGLRGTNTALEDEFDRVDRMAREAIPTSQ